MRSKHRGAYKSAHNLLILLNKMGKRDKLRGLPSILFLLHNEFVKFNDTRARMSDSLYHMTGDLRLSESMIRKSRFFTHKSKERTILPFKKRFSQVMTSQVIMK